MGNDDLRPVMRDDNGSDRDCDGLSFHGGSDNDEDEDLEWRDRQTDEAKLLQKTVRKWVSGELYFL
jgi:hypothetical protein